MRHPAKDFDPDLRLADQRHLDIKPETQGGNHLVAATLVLTLYSVQFLTTTALDLARVVATVCQTFRIGIHVACDQECRCSD